MNGWPAFVAGFMTCVLVLTAFMTAFPRFYEKRAVKRWGKKLPGLSDGIEVRLLEAMRGVARAMADVPESAIENGLAVSFGGGDEDPDYIVSVSRAGKRSFQELFLEAKAELLRLQDNEEKSGGGS